MKTFLSVVLCLMFIFPAWGFKEEKPYLAVYCNPGFEIFWPTINPDLLVVAFDWDHFDDFLRTIKKQARGRKIEIDIECHGDDQLMLQYPDARAGLMVTAPTTMGYIVNHIERILGKEKVTLILECCYAGKVYKNSIRNNKEGENCNHVPQFPIYGGSFNHMSLNNLIYLQYVTKCHRYFEDVRTYETKEGPKNIDRDEKSADHVRMSQLYKILAGLYDPS